MKGISNFSLILIFESKSLEGNINVYYYVSPCNSVLNDNVKHNNNERSKMDRVYLDNAATTPSGRGY